MVGILSVNVDELAANLFELREGGSLVIDKAAAFAFGINDTANC